jgi:hypothetical protein
MMPINYHLPMAHFFKTLLLLPRACCAAPSRRHATPVPRRLTAKQQTHAGASWWY